MRSDYQPRHARQLPAIFRGLADLIEPAARAGYLGRHVIDDSSDRRDK